jgi:flagellar motor switch protein FliG
MAQVQMHQIQMDSPRSQFLVGGGAPSQVNLLEAPRKAVLLEEGQLRDAEVVVELRPEHIEDLPIFLGAPEHASSAVAVLFLLPPEQAAKVISGMPEERRQSLVLEVSNTVHLDSEILAEAREKLRSFVESHAAGGKRLMETLALVPEEMQDTILKDLSAKSPKLARDLRESLLRFEDLLKLDGDALGLILTQTPAEQLALCLRGLAEPVRLKFLAALPENMRKVVAQYLALTAPQPLSKVREARRGVIDLWRRLAEEGRVEGARAPTEPLV